ncbi:MAG TPA: hypothetical protein VIK86_07825 [Candidatus Paceibacterota bacterium]
MKRNRNKKDYVSKADKPKPLTQIEREELEEKLKEHINDRYFNYCGVKFKY